MTNEENRKIFALADHAVDEIDLALGNEFELDARNRVEQILLKTVAQAIREAKVEAYDHWLDFVPPRWPNCRQRCCRERPDILRAKSRRASRTAIHGKRRAAHLRTTVRKLRRPS
jgi:hypothetical protein